MKIIKNKTEKSISGSKARNGERVLLEGLVQQQAHELKIKNGQLRNGIKKQKSAEKQIQVDATLIRKKELEIIKQREELLHVTRVGKLAEFVSSLAHEISQPLAAILSYTQAAQRMLADREPKTQEILRYIIDDDNRATEVIHRMRSLLKKGKPETKPLHTMPPISHQVALTGQFLRQYAYHPI